MILRRLYLRCFLGFSEEIFEFVPGINVVTGANESGKSSLRAAIRAALYGNPSTTSARIETYRTWGATQLPVVDLEFEVDGRPYRVNKDFEGRKAFLVGAGETLDQHKRIADRITSFLGLSTPEVFQNTAEVAQAELERVQLTSLSKELSRVLGGGADVDDAIKLLSTHIRDMERGQKTLARDLGELRKGEDRVKTLTAQHEKVVADIAQIERKQRDLTDLLPAVAELESSLAVKQKLLKTNLETQELSRQVAALRREESMLSERVGRIDQTRMQLAQVGRDLEAATAAGMPDEAVLRNAEVVESRVIHLVNTVTTTRGEGPSDVMTPSRRWIWPAAGGGLLLVAAVVAGTAVTPLVGIIFGLLGVLLTAGGAAAWNRERVLLQESTLRQLEHESRLRAVESELAAARQELAGHIESLGGESLQAATARMQRYRDLVRQREENVRVLEGVLLAGTTEEALRERLDRIRPDIYGLAKELESPERAAVNLPAFETQRLRDEIEALTKKTAEASERAKRLSWEIDHRKDQAEDRAAVEEQLQEALDALTAARHRHDVYRLALDGLQESRRLVERPVRDVVAGKASAYLRILSAGRYDRIEVEKDSLQLWVWSVEAGSRVEPREPCLSRGTIDLVYLSLRFALVTSLAEGRYPPLLLDDPFITFDDTRRDGAMHLLRELSRVHQVILFTCSPQYSGDADRVIVLPDRTVRAEVATTTAGQTASLVQATSPVQTPSPVPEPPTPVPAFGPLWEQTKN